MDHLHHGHRHTRHTQNINLTEGPVAKGLISFAIPLLLGQLLQQLYNMADAWVVGNFADNDAFAAVSSGGSLTFLIIGFFNGIAIGGGVIISRYFGAEDKENVRRAIHTNFLFGIIASILCTAFGLLLVPRLLMMMNTPESVLPNSLAYFRIYFAGVSTVIMYNICMAIMRALGDSLHPLYYLIFSSLVNVVLDLLFVAGFHWGVSGAAVATVIAQGLSALLCIIRMCRVKDDTRLNFRMLRLEPDIMKQVLVQGLPTGIQNSVISIGNIVIQSNINSFGSYAMSGHGAYAKIEGFAFLPIMCMSMALPTFISQNLGAKEYERAKKGALFGILFGMILAEAIGVLLYFGAPYALRFFVDSSEAVDYGTIQSRVVAPFFLMLAFSHCAAGVLRGCGKSFVPMVTMLLLWCGVRILYVTLAVRAFPVFSTISWAYPLTWSLSTVVFLLFLLKSDWTHTFEKKKA
ncbi:MAG: MATE family efflux transporter [Lachnospiraceae bacterium]|nr:MATE family efflux transporter [Lachnospiraceae bacterium]